jgi:hypothetical protein
MENNSTEHDQVRSEGPEHWEGRGQSDWDGSCVVITRKEDKGRLNNPESSGTLKDVSGN